MDPSLPVPTALDLDTVCDLLSAAQTERDEIAEGMEDVLQQLGSAQEVLDQWQHELQVTEAELSVQHTELSKQHADACVELDRLHEELTTAQAENRELKTNSGAAAGDAAENLHAEVEKWQSQCDALQRELLQAKTAAEQRIQSSGGETTEKFDELLEERTALEEELELVRERAAQLSSELNEERTRIAADRAEWSGELKQLRCLLEGQANLGNQGVPAMADVPVGCGATGSADGVVGSVVQQFDRIRQQRARRRSG